MLNQRDSIGLFTFDEAVRDALPPSQHPSHLKMILRQLDGLEAKGRSNVGAVLHGVAERTRRKGLFVVISDLLDDPAEILAGLHHLRYLRHEVILFHVIDHAELHFPFRQNLKLEGLEGLGERFCDPIAVRKSYLEELNRHLEQIRVGCRQDKVDYVQLDTSEPLDVALVRYLATRSEVKLT